MSEAASQKRAFEDEVMPEVAPISKRQKSSDGGGVQASEDVEMPDAISRKAMDEAPEGSGGADGGELGGSERSEGAAEAGTSEKKATKKTETGRPRRNKKKEKDRAEGEKRPARMRRRATKEEEEAARERKAQQAAQGISTLRYPKRQSALLIGFCGSGYSGMQIQPDASGVKTIEGTLFKALVKAGAVSQDNADDPMKVSLARAARTDAGVHAAGNVVSIKMIVTVPGVKDLVAHINNELPPEIRVWGFVRVQNSFNARLVCDSRKYTYYFPSYLLIPPKPESGLFKTLKRAEGSSGSSPSSAIHSFWQDASSATSTPEEDLVRKRAWRVGPADMERLRQIVKKYEGSHNFHNFTVGREFKDRSNTRFMKEIRIHDPVVHGNTEWISVLFHGQSFMLHQIRKMMAALVLTCRTESSPDVLDELYKSDTVFVPKMPSLGLLLEEPLFNSYNGRMAVNNEKLKPTDADYRPAIDFEQHREKIDAFKEEFIYKSMRGIEDQSGLFDAWVRSVDAYTGNDLLWLDRSGEIPSECIIKKGERRSQPFKEKRVFDATSFPSSSVVKEQLLNEDVVEGESDEEVFDKKQLAETEG